MPYCYVPLCKSGSASDRKIRKEQKLPKIHFFRPRSEEARLQWDNLIKRKDRRLTMEDRVCSLHFTQEVIILNDEFTIDGKLVKIPRSLAALKQGALPTIYNSYPVYYQPTLYKRKPPSLRQMPLKKSRRNLETPQHQSDDVTNHPQTLNDNMTNQHQNLNPSMWHHNKVGELTLPPNWVICNIPDDKVKVLAHINPCIIQVDKNITFEGSLASKVTFRNCKTTNLHASLEKHIVSVADAQKLLQTVDTMRVCEGTGVSEKLFSLKCHGAALPKSERCTPCSIVRESQQKKKARKAKRTDTAKPHRKQQATIQRSKNRLLVKIQKQRQKMNSLLQACSRTGKEVFEDTLKNLSKPQQEAVRNILNCSNKRGPHGRRYTIDWLYECILMRMKSPKLYNHIRAHDILPLPCGNTIRGYLKNYSGAYGFQPTTFQLLERKKDDLEEQKRRGVLMVDEIKLTPGVHFDTNTLKTGGFVNFGEGISGFGEEAVKAYINATDKLPGGDPATAAEAKKLKKLVNNKNNFDKNLGDHGLVVTYQPFQGPWIQNLACFLTKNAANDAQLTKIILEAVILTEKSGFYVDGIITDGAKWNRGMWGKFDVNEHNTDVTHPLDPERKIYFFSDFPHLMKCMRNCFLAKKIIQTDEGNVNLVHWQAVVEADENRHIGLKECPRLARGHLSVDNWSKMRCNLAWQFWSGSAAAGMESYRLQGVPALANSKASQHFCTLINKLSDVMNSRTPKDALRPDSAMIKVIDSFIGKLKEIQDFNMKTERTSNRGTRWVFSESTDVGLVVTLENTKKLLEFLTSSCNYTFLMTARLNQDALERFFGLMRQSCGGNTHPESRVFAQLFRLLSIYSLVKPIKGSNITGGEMLHTLLNLEDLNNKSNKDIKIELDKRLDAIISSGEDYAPLDDVVDFLHDHDYLDEHIDDYALVYVAGFTARRSSKFVNDCAVCDGALKLSQGTETHDQHLLIKLKSRGHLVHPSNELIALLREIEKQIMKVAKHYELEENILFLIVESFQNTQGIPMVGCNLHKLHLTKCIAKFYLIMRLHFLCKVWNKTNDTKKLEQRRHRKLAHLI